MLVDIAADALRDRVLVLRTLPQFATLDQDDLALLAERAHLVVAPRGTVLFREGAPLDRVFSVFRGAVRVHRGGSSRLVEAPGEVGLMSLFAGREGAREAVVERDATLLEFPADVLLTSFYDSVAIARNTIRLAARALIARRGNLPVRPEDAGEVHPGTYLDRSPTLVEKMLVMRRSPLWSRANLDALAELCRHVEEHRVPAGTVLWEVGEPAHHAYRLEYGIVRCTNAAGASVRVGGGHMVGGLDSLAGTSRSYRVETETDCIFFRIRSSTQLGILEVHPQLAARLRHELARQILEEQEAHDRA